MRFNKSYFPYRDLKLYLPIPCNENEMDKTFEYDLLIICIYFNMHKKGYRIISLEIENSQFVTTEELFVTDWSIFIQLYLNGNHFAYIKGKSLLYKKNCNFRIKSDMCKWFIKNTIKKIIMVEIFI
jgi:hypothetical protein